MWELDDDNDDDPIGKLNLVIFSIIVIFTLYLYKQLYCFHINGCYFLVILAQ